MDSQELYELAIQGNKFDVSVSDWILTSEKELTVTE